MKRILVLGSYGPSLVNFRGPLIAAMVSRGHQVIAAAPDIDPATASALRALGAEPRNVPIRNSSLNPLSLVQSLRAVRRLVRELRIELIFAYTIKPVIIGALVGRAEKVRTVVALITGLGFAFTGGRELKRLLSRWAAISLYRVALPQCRVILFQNTDDFDVFKRLGLIPRRRTAHVVNGSGVDLQHFAAAPLPRKISFLMIARLLKDKGICEFAEAAKRMKREYPEVPIGLVGYLDPSPDSLDQGELEDLVRCGIEFYGQLDDVRPAIARYAVYVLPSYREGMPRSVLEAMAMGRPIITTDAPGCRETVVPNENGVLVPVRDSEALYRAMLSFVLHPDKVRSMAAASRRRAEQLYDVDMINEAMLSYCGL